MVHQAGLNARFLRYRRNERNNVPSWAVFSALVNRGNGVALAELFQCLKLCRDVTSFTRENVNSGRLMSLSITAAEINMAVFLLSRIVKGTCARVSRWPFLWRVTSLPLAHRQPRKYSKCNNGDFALMVITAIVQYHAC